MTSETTLYSCVTRCECNAQAQLGQEFYFAKFEEADRQFRLMTGFSEALAGPRRVRHVRFLAPLTEASYFLVRSSIVFDGPHMLTLLHELVSRDGETVFATALDGYAPQPQAIKGLRARFKDRQIPMPEYSAPHALPASPVTSRPTLDDLRSQSTQATYRGTVLPKDVSAESRVDDAFAAQCFATAQAHLWVDLLSAHINPKDASDEEQAQPDLDREAAPQIEECKLSWISPLKNSDMVVVESGVVGVQKDGIVVRHHLFESRTNRLAAIADMAVAYRTGASSDIQQLPEDARRALSRLVLS